MLDQGMICIRGGMWGGGGRRFHRDLFLLLRMTHSLKLIDYLFLEFPSFQTSIDTQLKPQKMKPWIRGITVFC